MSIKLQYHSQTPVPSKESTPKSPKSTSPKLTAKKNYRPLQATCSALNISKSSFKEKRSLDTNDINNSQNSKPSNPGVVQNGPITPAFAKQRYRDYLSTYELTEINNFPAIYFVGRPTNSSNSTIMRGSSQNFGFDIPPTFHYKTQVGDHIAYRYEIINIFGKGSFGEVVKCLDHKNGTQVAIKILANTPLMHRQGSIEIQNMLIVNKMKSLGVEKVTDSFVFRNHICIVTEILGNSLFKYLEANNFAAMPMKLLKSVVFDITAGLADIHKSKIIHADLKPENILFQLGSTNHVKIIDFGSSCTVGHTIYNYLQSRFYRAPEIILGIPYGTPIDIWSFGCIVAELATGNPLFKGNSDAELLKKFVESLGNPPANVLAMSTRKSHYISADGKIIGNPTPFKTKLSSFLKTSDQHLLDFISKCLDWDPAKRITAAKLLNHPFIAKPKKI